MGHDIDQYWQKIRDGDEKSLEIVFKKIFAPLCKYTCQIIHDPFLSQEIVQDTLLQIWQNRDEIKIRNSFNAYIFQSVHNHALNALRQLKTKKQSVNHPGSDEIWQFIASHYNVDDDLAEKIFSDETELLIQKTVEELPEQCKRVFRMSRFESRSNLEIANELDLSENTVKTHIYRALHKITEILKKNN